MSSDNLGRYVKWQDEEEGWHTGRVVLSESGLELYETFGKGKLTLVKESCNGQLTWVAKGLLQTWQMRSEWEDLPIVDIPQALFNDQLQISNSVKEE